MTDVFDETTMHVAWTDYTGRSDRSEGTKSRLHRRDRYAEGRATCGLPVPTFDAGPRGGARVFEIDLAESTGYCLRCFPYACVRCRRRRAAMSHHLDMCCSVHRKRLCHECYRRTHFVEVCAPGCSRCRAEDLPEILTRRPVESTPDIATVGR